MTEGKAGLKRPLSQHERDLVQWLLENGVGGAARLLPQIERLSVVGTCTCGCPTIHFGVDGEPVEGIGAQIVSDYLAKVDGNEVGVILFAVKDRLSMLEVYSFVDRKRSFGLPAIESLISYETRFPSPNKAHHPDGKSDY